MTIKSVPGTPASKIERTPISTPGGSRVREEKIVVTVRLRPLNKREQLAKDNVSWECVDDQSIVYKPLPHERVVQPSSFTFDKVFGPEAFTESVYEEGVKTVALSALMGINEMGDKHVWSNDQLKCLLETCIEEVNKMGRKGLSLHKESWTRLGNVLKERFGIDLAQKQMKNAHDNLKAKYVGWCYLREKTGNIYNPQTNMFTLTNEEWEDFKKGHPKAGGLKTGPLPFPELCAQLFDGNTATGNSRWTPTQVTSGVGSNSNRGQSLMLMDSVFNEVEDDAGTSEGTTEPTSEPTYEPNPDGNPKKKTKTSKKTINSDDLAANMNMALQTLIKGKEGSTFTDCAERLKLVGLNKMDPLFLAAFNIFGRGSDMREAWMTLPEDPEVLHGWITMTAKNLGLIKE